MGLCHSFPKSSIRFPGAILDWRVIYCPLGVRPQSSKILAVELPRGVLMSDVIYTSKVHIERKVGPLRVAKLPGEPQPVVFSVHGAIAEHYKVKPADITEPHAATLDYVIAATAG